MFVPKLFYNTLFLTAHLLLAGFLLGALLCLLLPQTGIQQFYLARAGAGVALLLLAWVGVLLVWRLRERRWEATCHRQRVPTFPSQWPIRERGGRRR